MPLPCRDRRSLTLVCNSISRPHLTMQLVPVMHSRCTQGRGFPSCLQAAHGSMAQ